jgi:8-oxo-dGTP pyrophosphatase MutT (NUDIX family)
MRAIVRHAIGAELSRREPQRVDHPSYVRASVLVPLFEDPDDGSPRIWLVRRPDSMRTHRGQVALPGGKWEKRDRSLLETALREAEEEIGLARDRVEVLGVLDDCVTITGYVITPHVGWIAEPFTPTPLPEEVAHVFSVRLSVFEGTPTTLGGSQDRPPTHSFVAEGETIWGATARILRQLASLARR